MRSTRRVPTAAVLALLGLGCGPVTEQGEPEGSSSSASEASSSSGALPTGSSSSSSSSDGADGSTTATPDDGGYEDDDGGTGCTFTCPDPPPPTPPPNSNGWCGLECPRGEKCMPWANDGGDAWNTFRCSPLADDPGVAGEPCMVEGSGVSGIDDCDVNTICWQVDPMTNEGVCHAACGTVDGGYQCDEPLGCALLDNGVPLCVQTCDPLAPSCPAGHSCTFLGASLACQPLFGDTRPLGQPCSPDFPCESGTLCAYDPAVSCGNEAGQGCCALPCDVNDPVACTGPEICVPWFPLRPPPALAHLGVCAPP